MEVVDKIQITSMEEVSFCFWILVVTNFSRRKSMIFSERNKGVNKEKMTSTNLVSEKAEFCAVE